MIENFKLKVFRVVADELNYRWETEELHPKRTAVTAQLRWHGGSLGIARFDRRGRETCLMSAEAALLSQLQSDWPHLRRCPRAAAAL